MKTSATYTFDIAANATYRLLVGGAYFKLLATTGNVDIKTQDSDLKGMSAGQGVTGQEFSYLAITDKTGATNTIKIVVSDAEFIDSLNGNVGISTNRVATSAAFANTAATVTNASAQLLAANTSRQYLMIQNKDAAGDIYINFGAGAATTVNGIKIPAGGYFEWFGCVPTSAVQAIGSTASNTNVLTVQG